jgi:hypothetical protein
MLVKLEHAAKNRFPSAHGEPVRHLKSPIHLVAGAFSLQLRSISIILFADSAQLWEFAEAAGQLCSPTNIMIRFFAHSGIHANLCKIQ